MHFETVVAALVAGAVSVTVGVISYLSNRSAVRHQVQQSQFRDVLLRRIELYPKLWRIHICYETHWVLDGKPKTREWAQQYLAALNEFNLEGGVFFSEGLYQRFRELRDTLHDAVRTTAPNTLVESSVADLIRETVYGRVGKPGLSAYEKDDLGSYQSMSLQVRASGV